MKTIPAITKFTIVFLCCWSLSAQSATAIKSSASNYAGRKTKPDFTFVVPINIKAVKSRRIIALVVVCGVYPTENATSGGSRASPFGSGNREVSFSGGSLNKTIRVHVFLSKAFLVDQFKSYKCDLLAMKSRRLTLSGVNVSPTATASERANSFVVKEGSPTRDLGRRKVISYIGKL